MDYYWQQLIALIMAPTLVVGAVAWLLRSILDQGMKRDIEKFKIELERESFEKKQQFSLIHQKRADVIATFYGKLVKTKVIVNDLVGIFQQGGQSLIEKKKKVSEVFNDTALYFHQNKIFFPDTTAEKSEQILEKLHHALIDFDTAQMGNEEYKPDDSGLWKQAYKSVRDEIPPILKDLETEFKTILGMIEGET